MKESTTCTSCKSEEIEYEFDYKGNPICEGCLEAAADMAMYGDPLGRDWK